MWPLVTLGTRYLYFLGSIVLAAIISASSGGQTGVNGAAIMVPDFTTAGVASRTAKVPVMEPFVGFLRGTGSTTVKYPSGCFRNPLFRMSKGSGTVVRLAFHVGNNPSGLGGDVGLTKGCDDSFGSGSRLLIDGTCTQTGCTSYYTTGTATINNDEYIKFTPRGNLTTSFTGRISGTIEDMWGE